MCSFVYGLHFLLNNSKIAACTILTDTLTGQKVHIQVVSVKSCRTFSMPVSISALSHNRISVLGEQSFRTLPFLHTLLLDHNLLTDQALQEGALTNLTQMEVLALGHNLISMVCCKYIIKIMKLDEALAGFFNKHTQALHLSSRCLPL